MTEVIQEILTFVNAIFHVNNYKDHNIYRTYNRK